MTTAHVGDCQTGCDTCTTNYHEGKTVCDTCGRRVDDAISYGELAELTHESQVAQFGFCTCEDLGNNPAPYEDCPNQEYVHDNRYLTEILESHGWLDTDEEEIYTEALEAWVGNAPTYYLWEKYEDWFSDFEDSYQGWWDSRQEFADQLADETITPELPEVGQLYFDYNKFARDLFFGDYWESNGYVFRSN